MMPSSSLGAARYRRAVNAYHRQRALQIVEQTKASARPHSQAYQFFGGNAEFIKDVTSKEKIIAGPAETGKTIAALYYVHQCALQYSGASIAILRNVYRDLHGTVLETFHKKILPFSLDDPRCPVRPYGGTTRPIQYIYPNGSVIWLGGLDRPGSALSAERDLIYINQAEEISEEARNKLLSRVTGRAGNMPYAQLLYDANPADPYHWMLRLRDAGRLSFYESKHIDNPSLYKIDPKTGEITDELTEQGKITMATLDNLTGVDRDRLFLGLWTQASGLIYGDTWQDGREDGNVRETAVYLPGAGDIYWAADDGYAGEITPDGYFTAESHPRTFGFYQLRNTGELILFHEDYAIRELSDQHLARVRKYSRERGWPDPVFVTVDKSAAELKGRLHAAGYYTRNSPSSVDESIKEARRWMAKDENGRRRFLVHPDCKHTRFEYRLYRRDDNGKIVKAYDHGPDRDRYMIWTIRHRYDG